MKKQKSVVRSVGGAVLGFCLNPKARRMILVVSVATYLHTFHKAGEELPLSKINEMADLSGADKALEFPAIVGNKIWEGSGIEKIDMSSGVDAAIPLLLKKIPSWLRYGRQSDMERDLRSALQFV